MLNFLKNYDTEQLKRCAYKALIITAVAVVSAIVIAVFLDLIWTCYYLGFKM